MYSISNAITEDEQQQILKTIMAPNFPWYYQSKNTVIEHPQQSNTFQNTPFMNHSLIARYNEKNFSNKGPGIVNSDFWPMFEPIIKGIIDYTTIFRASLNLTWGNNSESALYTIPHVDHYFKHKNCILYLNKFSNGHTYIVDKTLNVIGEIIPEERKAAVFDGLLHCAGFCKPDEIRLVLVVTFERK